MKLRLLSFVAVAAMSLTAMAQTWTAPVQPQLTGSDLEEGGEYYLLNVGTGQFVTGAHSWATQISLSSNGTPYVVLIAETIEAQTVVKGTKGNDNTAEANGWTLRLKEKYNLTGANNRTQGQEWTKGFTTDFIYLFRNDETTGFVDMNNQGKFVWSFTKTESGNYYWQTAPEDPNYPNAAEQYAAGVKAGSPIIFNATIEDPNIEWRFVKPADYSDDYAEQTARYNALKALYDQHLVAAENEVNDSKYAAVYNNANATIEEINAATASLRSDITRAVVIAKIAESSETNPIDITSVTIINPDFEQGQEPWTITEGMGQNLQVQGTGYPHDADGNPIGDAFVIQNFIEAWRSGAALSDGVICQTVTGLPEGRYRIECDALAVWQADPSIDQTGIYLFYNNGSYTLHAQDPISTGNGEPEHFTFDFDYDGSTEMTIGLMAENTNCNWMGMDNFRLYAIGECKDSPLWTALNVVYANLVNSGYVDEVKAEASLVSELNSALDNVKDLIDQPSDNNKNNEYQAAYDAVDAARKAVTESEAAYKKLKSFIDQLDADQSKYSGTLLEYVEDLYSQYNDSYENGDITAAEIEAAIAGYADGIKEKTREMFENAAAQQVALDEPINITALFDNMTFAYGTSQTAFANGYPADAPVWMNETATGNFKTNYSTAEVWDARPFNIYRDFTDLPKGNYTIKTHAFFRVEANDANYPNWQADNEYGKGFATLYAGVNHTPIPNLAQLASPILADLDAPYDCLDGNYLPNNQHSANMIFTDAKYANLAGMCYIGASGNVLEDGGTLRAGIQGTSDLQGNQWTIWYGFELYYNGVANLDEDIQSLMAQLEDTEDLNVTANVTMKANALAAADRAIGADFDTQTSAIKQLQEAIAELSQTMDLYNQMLLIKADMELLEQNLTISPTDSEYPNLNNEIDQAGEGIESNAQIKGWIENLPKSFKKYVLSAAEMADATEESPVDLSAAFLNPTFDNNNKNYWNVEQEGNAGGDGDGVAEFWGATSFNIYQSFESLPAGYYRLSVDALYRFGGTKTELNALEDGSYSNPEVFYVNGIAVNVMAWSNTEGGAYTEEGYDGVNAAYSSDSGNTTVYSCNDKAHFATMNQNGRYHNEILFGYGVQDGLNGTITIGLRKDSKPSPDNDWCPFDNFRLEYLGTVAPDAVESLNADATAPAVIYGIDGRQQSQLRRGINIVRKGGNVEKILVK